jgi:hypothetical protein
MCPWIEWSHTPKARHIGNIRVKYFLKERAVRRISSAAEQSVHLTRARLRLKNVFSNN